MDRQAATAAMFFQTNSLPPVPFPQFPGLTARLVAGDRLMTLLGRLEPGTVLPLHRHPHEQLTYVLEGTAHLQIGDEGRDLGPGDGAMIPDEVLHGIVRVGPTGCTILEVYTPLREEYLAAMRQAAPGT